MLVILQLSTSFIYLQILNNDIYIALTVLVIKTIIFSPGLNLIFKNYSFYEFQENFKNRLYYS